MLTRLLCTPPQFLLLVSIGMWIPAFVAAQDAAPEVCKRVVVLNVDPVDLVAGKETPAVEAHSVDRGVFTYRFASAANKAKFEADATRYEVQLGGACARMGPLSGLGRADIFGVHNGRIYLFASRQCRDTFLKSPETFIEADDSPPKPTDAQRKRGMELIELAAKAAGGQRLDAMKTLALRADSKSTSGGQEYAVARGVLFEFPSRFRRLEAWDTWVGGEVIDGGKSFFAAPQRDLQHPLPLVDSQLRAVRRIMNREPAMILRARKSPGFIAAHVGNAELGGRRVERVAAHFDGTTTTLAINADDGSLVGIAYRGRGPSMRVGEIELTFTAQRADNGVILPSAWTATCDGKPADALNTILTTFEIDRPLPPDTFTPGKL